MHKIGGAPVNHSVAVPTGFNCLYYCVPDVCSCNNSI
ncbi:hypothetical protein EG68_02782 [Paragonimus skrjabini miyazakii]|uniref:Uncharacterized protein n=1 Tax=Paragonimus skrjabini miyazakii TaxID=59628 RepID=A0A8S9Z2D9_9TREM|nr:hypothetical protein EG68_02782 [Paragonimus skrjabini miyazakii]